MIFRRFLAAACPLLVAPFLHAAAETIGPGVLEQIESTGAANIVIALKSVAADQQQTAPGAFADQIARLQQEVLSEVGPEEYQSRHTYSAIPAMAGRLTGVRALRAVAAHPHVVRIDLDAAGTGELADSVPLIHADLRHTLGNTGTGVVVAVLDSGIDTDHTDLRDALIAEACFGDLNGRIDGVGFCPNGSDRQTGPGSAEDDAGHGTHVTGIITSNGTRGSVGVAPGTGIVSIKVTGGPAFRGLFFYFSEVVAALDYLIRNPGLNVRVINMSIGTDALFADDCDNSTAFNMAGASAINTLRANGVIAFASAGNQGSATRMSSPACLSNVVSVGAADSSGNPAAFTDSSATTDLFAPGISITSSLPGNRTGAVSGTSMAAPHAAACAALMIETGEATTPDQIEALLESSPRRVRVPASASSYPLIDCAPSTHLPATMRPKLLCPGDINHDGVADLALVTPTGRVQVTGIDGAAVNTFDLTGIARVASVALMRDTNGNGSPELLALGRSPAAVEARDLLNSGTLGAATLQASLALPAIAVIPDRSGNGVPEFAVVNRNPATVTIHDGLTAQVINRVNLPGYLNARDLRVHPDSDGNGWPEIAVLGDNRRGNGADNIEIHDPISGALVRALWLGKGWNVLQHRAIADLNGNGSEEIAVLRVHPSGQVNVLFRDPVSGARLGSTGFDPAYLPSHLLALKDLNGNGSDEVVVFGQRLGTAGNNQRASIRDSRTGRPVGARHLFFDKNAPARDVVTCSDINGNGAEELAMLGQQLEGGNFKAIVKDSRTGERLGIVRF